MKKNRILLLLALIGGISLSCASDKDELKIPLNVSIDHTGINSLTFSWNSMSDAEGYRYKLLYEDGIPVKIDQTNETSVTFQGLTSSTKYKFAVQCVAGENESAYSDFIYAETRSLQFNSHLPDWENDGLVRAFPGAEGGGMYTTGGRGGKVYHVTSLADTNTPGTLRYAVSQSGTRTIVFDVDGIIELQSSLVIRNGNLTIAGQTARGDGICLKNYGLSVSADNVIIRFIRCRMGNEAGVEGDALDGRWHKNVIIDHCSMSWSTDECASFYGMEDFTMQWCILGESLRNSDHAKGTHGYGAIWGGVNASYHHNLLAHHDSRNARFDGFGSYAPHTSNTDLTLDMRAVDYRNCVVYNFSGYTAYGGEGIRMNYEGNYYKWGPGSEGGAGISYKDGNVYPNSIKKRQEFFRYSEESMPMWIYVSNNSNYFTPDRNKLNNDNWNGFIYSGTSSEGGYRRLNTPVSIKPGGVAAKITYHTAEETYERVLGYAGANLKRDAVDMRIVNDVRTGTATCMAGSNGSINGYIDSQQDVGGWPQYNQGAVNADSDGDGIPDEWEEQFGLNKNSAADGNAFNLDPSDRYTNLEIYLHWLVKDIISDQVEGGNYISQ